MFKKYIIFTPSFDETSGGIIALHRLCDLLNQNGQKAYLWDWDKPIYKVGKPFTFALTYFKYLRHNLRQPFRHMTNFETPLASYEDLQNAIVIYPEIVEGNPLCAKHIVRWFLHKPGFHTGRMSYGENELYFFYQTVFNDISINPNEDHLLQTIFLRDDIYKQVNFGSRKGTCYMLRKGKGREIVHDLQDSVFVDDFNHTQMAEIFNKVEMFISYDPYTMYSQFAALCGAVSVIIPEENISKKAWFPDEKKRYGIAYGFDDIPNALATRHLLLPTLKEQEKEAHKTVENFIQKCTAYFR